MKKKYKYIFFLLVFSSNLSAQTEEVILPTVEFNKWQFGFNLSPDYCFRTLVANSSATSQGVQIVRDDSEGPKLGYTSGLVVAYNFNKSIRLEMGLLFSNKGYQFKKTDLTFGDMIDPRRGFVYSSSDGTIESVKFIYSYYYIDVPAKVNFAFGKRKIRLLTSVGLVTNIFLNETSTSVLYFEDGSKNRNTSATTDDYNRINLSPQLGAGIDWKLNEKSNLRIEPTFRYGMLSIIDAPITGYLWSFGLNINYLVGLK